MERLTGWLRNETPSWPGLATRYRCLLEFNMDCRSRIGAAPL